jgi:hypothetical protein
VNGSRTANTVNGSLLGDGADLERDPEPHLTDALLGLLEITSERDRLHER